ncbi:proteasome accessory factor C [Kineosphaera limosa]|uniref:Proteasome accessory factor C n=1 Tax=Kineosphaera limosa NBRC 100340 TaxID=1184609 RepID=K6X6V4_9MICO|nr:WYL domain-containing protein [Kineosphaera limosa]NYE03222.1 proteasome accessory factor C [Kineosphaera limosa]GAB94559.1 proteasome accessory factor C [Kineosphaera limosa NBRC 100340]
MSQESSTSRVARLLTMVPWLLAHPGVPVAQAAAEFGLGEKAFVRDLELLFLCGTPGGMPDDLIEAEWETGRVYLGNADEIARPLRLSREEALSLIVALRAIEATGQVGDSDVVATTLAKLEQATGSAARPQLDEVGRRIHVEVAEEAESQRLLQLQGALADRRRVRLDYHVPSRDEVTTRDVDPMRLFAQDGHWYLEAYCHRAADVRLFRLDRIESATVLDIDGTPPAQAQARDLDAGVYQGGSGDLLVELELSPAARWVADYYPHESRREVAAQPGDSGESGESDGTMRLVLRVGDPAWLRRLLWRLGGSARVVEPEWLARDVAAGARHALLAYGDNL